jgi:diaphanous 1
MLSRIKLGLPEIKKALVEINDGLLTVDDLKAISKQLPTAEEVTCFSL